MVTQISVAGITINGKTYNGLEEATQDVQNQIDSGEIDLNNIDPSSLDPALYDKLSDSQKRTLLDSYNKESGHNLTLSELNEKVHNPEKTIEEIKASSPSGDLNRDAQNIITENPSTEVIDKIENTDLTTINLEETLNNQVSDENLKEIINTQNELQNNNAQIEAQKKKLADSNAQIEEQKRQLAEIESNLANNLNQTQNVQSDISHIEESLNEIEKKQASGTLDQQAYDQALIEAENLKKEQQKKEAELLAIQAEKTKLEKDKEQALQAQLAKERELKLAEDQLKLQELKSEQITDKLKDQITSTDSASPSEEPSTGDSNETSSGGLADLLNQIPEFDGDLNIDTTQGNLCYENGVCLTFDEALKVNQCRNTGNISSECNTISEKVTKDSVAGDKACLESNDPKAKACRDAGNTWNCEYGQCLSAENIKNLSKSGSECLYKKTKAEQENCFKSFENTVVEKAASGEFCQASGEKVSQCQSQGKIWNCEADACLSSYQNNVLKEEIIGCFNKDANEQKSSCLDQLKKDGPRLLATTCESGSSSEAKQCRTNGQAWNCLTQSCVHKDVDEKIVDAALSCLENEADPQCQSASNDLAKTIVQNGGQCQQSTDAANQCEASGGAYNCQYNQCLSEADLKDITDKGLGCFKSEDQAQCLDDLKMDVVKNAARGQYCEESAQSKVCAAEGKKYNCNIGDDICVSDYQNEVIAEEVEKCFQGSPTNAMIEACLDTLEENGPELLATTCDLSNNPDGKSCNDAGHVWNCVVEVCVDEDFNNRLVNAWKNCQEKPTKEEKDQCMAELDELAEASKKDPGFSENDLENPGSPTMAANLLVSTILGLVGALVGGICASAFINVAAGVMASMTEKNSEKQAKTQLKSLREQYRQIEDLKNQQAVSYDIQVKAIEFYIHALKTGEQIAGNYAKGYKQSAMIFGMAAAVAAIETTVYAMAQNWPMVTCAGIQIGSAGLLGGLSMKAASVAEQYKSDFESQRRDLERILEIFNKHFGNYNGIQQFAGGSKSGTNGLPATNLGANSIEGKTAEGENPSSTNGDNPEFASENVCADKNGKIDESCACRDSGSCFQLDPNIFADTAVGKSLSNELGFKESFNEVNDIASGRISASDLDGTSLARRSTKVRKAVKKLARQANKSLKKNGHSQRVSLPTNKQLAAAVNRAIRSGQASAQKGSLLSNVFSGVVSPSEIKDFTEKMKNSLDDKGHEKNIKTSLASFHIPKKINFKDLDSDIIADEHSHLNNKDQAVLNSQVNRDPASLKDLGDVHNDSTQSLWDILTTKYHKVVKERRVGKFRKLKN